MLNKKRNAGRYIPAGLLVLSAVFMGIGIFVNEEYMTILNKATKICLECIGIG